MKMLYSLLNQINILLTKNQFIQQYQEQKQDVLLYQDKMTLLIYKKIQKK
jgi:hypothetical protein